MVKHRSKQRVKADDFFGKIKPVWLYVAFEVLSSRSIELVIPFPNRMDGLTEGSSPADPVVHVSLRIGLLFALLVSSAISTALPVFVSLKFYKHIKKEPPWRKLVMSSLNCFAGGVFLGVTFLHLLPNLSEGWAVILKDIWPSKYPFNNFLVVMGFFLILVIEQFAHMWQFGSKKEPLVEKVQKDDSNSQVTIKRYRSQPNILASIQGLEEDREFLSLQYHSDCSECERHHRGHLKRDSTAKPRPLAYNTVPHKLPTDPRSTSTSNSSPRLERRHTADISDRTALLPSEEGEESPFTTQATDNDAKETKASSNRQSVLRAVFLAVALSVHSIFEGLAFGLIENEAVAIEVFIGIIIHKTVIGLSLGIAFVTSKSNICLALVLTIIFVVSSPVGIAIGLGIHTHTGDSSASRVTSAVLEAIACGTFIYITFLELIGHEFLNVQSSNARHQLGLVLCAVLGFCLLAGLTFLPH